MNLSEVHSLSPAFPDVGGRVVRWSHAGGDTSIGAGHTIEIKKSKLKTMSHGPI